MEAEALRCSSCGAAVGETDIQCPYCRSQLATVACPGCFALVSVRAKHCSRCGTAVQAPETVASDHACPECRIPVAKGTVGAAEVEQCHRCGGLWLDVARFETLAADRQIRGEVLGVLPGVGAGEKVFETAVRYRPCPQCGKFMNRLNYGRISGVVLDACKDHGLWFDPDELRRVLAFIEGGGLEKARERRIQELEERQRAATPMPSMDWGEAERRPGPGMWDLLDVVEGLVGLIKR